MHSSLQVQTVAVVVLLLTLVICGTYCNSIGLKRKEHKWYEIEESPISATATAFRAKGNSVKLNGGILTLGTFIAPITIGSQKEVFNMIIDTGSSNIALPGKGCKGCGKAANGSSYYDPSSSSYSVPSYYDPSSSRSFVPLASLSPLCLRCSPLSSPCHDCAAFFGKPIGHPDDNCTFGITYGGGSSGLEGYYGHDIVCFGGYCSNVTVGLIQTETPANSFNTGKDDNSTGILGLASQQNACNPSCVLPIFDQFVQDGLVDNLFSVCLTPANGGVLDLGLIDNSKYTGALAYAPITFDRWYNVLLMDIKIGDHSIGVPNMFYKTTNDVIGSFIDTGTSMVLLGPVAYSALENTFQSHFSSLPALSNLFRNTCVLQSAIPNINAYPNITIEIKGENSILRLPIPPQSYLINLPKVYCFGITSVPGIGAVLGDVFMENYYIVFDRKNNRLGFADVVSSKCTTTP